MCLRVHKNKNQDKTMNMIDILVELKREIPDWDELPLPHPDDALEAYYKGVEL